MNLAVNHGFSPWSNPSPLSINSCDLYYKLFKKIKKKLIYTLDTTLEEKSRQSPHGSLNIRLPAKWTLSKDSNLVLSTPGLQKSLSRDSRNRIFTSGHPDSSTLRKWPPFNRPNS